MTNTCYRLHGRLRAWDTLAMFKLCSVGRRGTIGNWYYGFLIRMCLSFQILNLCRILLPRWGSIELQPICAFLLWGSSRSRKNQPFSAIITVVICCHCALLSVVRRLSGEGAVWRGGQDTGPGAGRRRPRRPLRRHTASSLRRQRGPRGAARGAHLGDLRPSEDPQRTRRGPQGPARDHRGPAGDHWGPAEDPQRTTDPPYEDHRLSLWGPQTL